MSPSQFAKEKLDLNCWSKMEEIFQAVENGERKILVRSCNGAGKTTALAAICNWFLSTKENSIVLTTASSWMQVRRNLWGEIRRQARAAKLYKDDQGHPLKLGETLIKLNDKHYMIGISPNIPENAMGFHAPHILVAVDEATGVDREIFDALTGNLSGTDSQIVLICNPIDQDSYAYEAEQSGQWKVIHISAFDHPNVVNDTEEITGAVTRTWVMDRLKSWTFEIKADVAEASRAVYIWWLEKWFRRNSIVDARILGEWAHLESAAFIPLELIKRNVRSPVGTPCEKRGEFPPFPEGAPRIRALGVDISRGVGGDANAYASFDVHRNTKGSDGENLPDIQRLFQAFYDDDLMDTADRIRSEYEKCLAEGIRLIIAVDDTGVGGGVSDKLKRDNIPIFAVNFNHKPKGFLRGKEVANARAEMYFLLHDELLSGEIQLIDFKRFHQELSSIQLDVSKATNGAYKMEDKELTRRRLGRSPDYAAATALARYALRLQAANNRDWELLMGLL